MIKITKDLNDIPKSLDDSSGAIGSNTHTKRLELIDRISYIDTAPYNNRYKYSDTKEKLKIIYNGKCAFCENKVEQLHVEHYRPKAIYYWLAFSWDNLLMACPTCNQRKSSKFETQNAMVTYDIDFLNNYNSYSFNYDRVEQPKLINPEVTDPSSIFTFSKNGKISSDDPRGIYTIETCELDRDYLNDDRKKILDDFRSEIEIALATFENPEDIKRVLIQTLNSFKSKAQNTSEVFIAFRRNCIELNFLEQIIQESLP